MSRKEALEAMLLESPDDVFLRYALAMEFDSREEHERSLEIHQQLTRENPPYVPSFFMSAQQLVRLDRSDEAKPILLAGIQQAEKQSDLHAAAEMREFLETID